MATIIEKLKTPFLSILLFILLVVYVCRILHTFIQIIKIYSCIFTLFQFINSATPSRYGPVDQKDNFDKYMYKVLKKYPSISEFTSFSSPSLSYAYNENTTYNRSISLYQELLMNRNYLIKDFKKCLNPLSAVVYVISLPSSFIQWIGFKPKATILKLVNLFAWLLAYLLNIYGEDIKGLINSFLQSP